MSDVASAPTTPAAPAPATANGTPPGALQAPAKGPAPKPAVVPTPKAPGAPGRAPDGRFATPAAKAEPAPGAGTAGGAQLADPAGGEGGDGAEPAPAETKEPELYEVVIDGEKRSLTREQLISRAQRAEAANKRFQEASALAKKAQAAIERLEKEPLAVLLEHGVDVGALSTKHLAERAEEALLSPEQRELKAAQAELARYKDQETKAAAQKQEAEQKAAYDQVATHLEKSFIEAATKTGLETSPDALEMMTTVALEAVELKLNMTVEQIAAEAKERLDALASKRDAKVAAGLTGEKLLHYLGPKTVEAVLKASLEKLKGASPYRAPAAPAAEPAPAAPAASRFISPAEWQKL